MGQETTTYTLDYAAGMRVLAERTVTGTTMYLYGHGCLGEFDDAADEWLYYLNDATGLVRQGVDEQRQVESTWVFDPDGLVLEGPEGPVSHLVCGGVYDWSTGLIYKDQRYFDPTLGIWLALAPLMVVQSRKKRKKRRWWHPWYVVLLCVMGVGGMLVGCTRTPDDEDNNPVKTSLHVVEQVAQYYAGLNSLTVRVGQTLKTEDSEKDKEKAFAAIAWEIKNDNPVMVNVGGCGGGLGHSQVIYCINPRDKMLRFIDPMRGDSKESYNWLVEEKGWNKSDCGDPLNPDGYTYWRMAIS